MAHDLTYSAHRLHHLAWPLGQQKQRTRTGHSRTHGRSSSRALGGGRTPISKATRRRRPPSWLGGGAQAKRAKTEGGGGGNSAGKRTPVSEATRQRRRSSQKGQDGGRRRRQHSRGRCHGPRRPGTAMPERTVLLKW
jgi:hypothetical protein